MLVNFAHEGLAKIRCDCVQCDGRGVSNLISLDKRQRAKGFMADRFIKPPVSITFLFACDVNISKIALKPRVGGQKSSGFEILKVFKNRAVQPASIARTVISDDVERVVFGQSDPSDPGVRFCSERAAERVRELSVKIFKTSGSTVPGLGGLEIWGRPSPHLPDRIKNDIIAKWKSVCCQPNPGTTPKSTEEPEPTKQVSTPAKASFSPDLNIPEEFIDPISCEIMTIPMTLPSGNTVDLTTLEKFHDRQSEMGRPKCDPFTGVLFSDRSQPVMATSLKYRLDKFLLEHSNLPSIKSLPRALGRRPYCPASSSVQGSSVSEPTPKPSACKTVDQLLSKCLDGLPSYSDARPPQTKRPKIGCISCSQSNNSYLFKLPCQDVVCRECLCAMKLRDGNTCSLCRAKFEFANVIRYHT